MKDAQTDQDFQVVARVEAFIAGWGLDEALRRADAYRMVRLIDSDIFDILQHNRMIIFIFHGILAY